MLSIKIFYDKNLKIYSGYFLEYPEAIGHGETFEEFIKDIIGSLKQITLLKIHLNKKKKL